MRKFLLILTIIFLIHGIAIAEMIDNGDGTVTDTTTGLMWQQATAAGTYTWMQALAHAETSGLGNYDNWRVPNINELLTLVDDSSYEPAIYDLFKTTTQNEIYWSSTTYSNTPVYAWGIDFTEGATRILEADKDAVSLYVRLVRTID
jgi:hypothetical protein